jgi:hypothetical protein
MTYQYVRAVINIFDTLIQTFLLSDSFARVLQDKFGLAEEWGYFILLTIPITNLINKITDSSAQFTVKTILDRKVIFFFSYCDLHLEILVN